MRTRGASSRARMARVAVEAGPHLQIHEDDVGAHPLLGEAVEHAQGLLAAAGLVEDVDARRVEQRS